MIKFLSLSLTFSFLLILYTPPLWAADGDDLGNFIDDPLGTEELDAETTDEVPNDAEPTEDPAEETPLSQDTQETEEPTSPKASPAENETGGSYTLSLTLEGDIAFIPKTDAVAGGLEEVSVSYRLSLEADVAKPDKKIAIQPMTKVEAAVSGYLFNTNNVACELHIDIPETETAIEISPKEKDDEISAQVKISWPNKIEELWESYCLVSAEKPFITSGELETAFHTLLKHADPELSSFVIPEDTGAFRADFTMEFYDEEGDSVYEQNGTGSGTFSLVPKTP